MPLCNGTDTGCVNPWTTSPDANRDMRDDQKPHPGLWRVMQVDSGIAGIVIAAGFLVLGLASMPTLAPIFLFGAVPFGVAVALLLRFTNTRR